MMGSSCFWMTCQKRMEPCMKEGRNQKHKQLLSLLAACVGAKAVCKNLWFSVTCAHLRPAALSCWSSGVCAAESLWIYSGSTAGLCPRGILHLWMCRVELCLGSWQSWAMFVGSRELLVGQESTVVSRRELMAFLTFTGPAASHSTEIRVSCQLLWQISALKIPTIVNFHSLHDYVHLNEG